MQKTFRYLFIITVLTLFVILSGCATTEHYTSYNSVTYRHYSATGYASFYGHHDGMNGKKMADGRRFNAKNKHEAAHPTLPLGTKLKVIDLRTHKTLYVEVTDRMGHVRGRIIDLSYAAAKYFHMQGRGLMRVRIVAVHEHEYKKHLN